MGDLDDKVAIVTGGANGIGRSITERLVAEGAHVVVADVDADNGEMVAGDLGERAQFRRTDVTSRDDVQRLVDATVAQFGQLDVMCNNAGVSGSLRRFLDDDLRDFERVASVDLLGVMVGCSVAARHMLERGGSIVNIGSAGGVNPGVGMLPYRAVKAGVAHFTRSLAVEVGEHGIRANCIAPANIATGINAAFDKSSVLALQPLPHQGLPDDVAEAALYLASDRSAHVTGTVLVLDGGMGLGTPPRGRRREEADGRPAQQPPADERKEGGHDHR